MPTTLDEMKTYYDQRAAEYDEWYLGTGLYAARPRPGWHEEVWEIEQVIANLTPVRTLDVACGTGFLTRFVRGEVSGLDQSQRMIEIATLRVPGGRFTVGDGLALPFADNSFDRVMAGHFYGHLNRDERVRFLAEARRVANELVIVDAALHDGVQPEEQQERILNDGSRHQVYKRYFDPNDLVAELGGGQVLHGGVWFVVVATPLR
jgi:demethylmenaquinone methyltransferase/2-methoxy-6-polyprenyl-1,4-benzoquinol methylase